MPIMLLETKVDASMRILKHHVTPCLMCQQRRRARMPNLLDETKRTNIRRIVALWCHAKQDWAAGGMGRVLHARECQARGKIETSPTSDYVGGTNRHHQCDLSMSRNQRHVYRSSTSASTTMTRIAKNHISIMRMAKIEGGRSLAMGFGSEPAALEELRNPSPRAREVVHKLFDELKKANGETSALEVTFGRRFDVTRLMKKQ
ncbi:hypothetical protein NFJ02_03g101140 [Pycnococcus provasolii]